MAPEQFPTPPAELWLEDCLTGKLQLISWETAYIALCDPETATKSSALRDFLRDRDSLSALCAPWQPFPAPSAHERQKFDAKTAPINVATRVGAGYNFDEIKADALWLSKLAHISEYVALQLAMLEWQNRPKVQLLSGLTQEEALSVNDAAGLSSLGASTIIPNSSLITSPSGLADVQFDAEDQRKLRLLRTYTTTRISLLRTSQLLVAWGGAEPLRRTHGADYRVCSGWLEDLGKEIAAKQCVTEGGALEKCIDAVSQRWNAVDNGFAWDVPDTVQESAAALWLTAQVTEIIHLLHISLLHADLYTDTFVKADTVERWFTSLAERDFFCNLTIPLPEQQHLAPLVQMLVSLLSLAVLKVDVVLEDLQNGNSSSWSPACYLLSGSVLETITNIFGRAKALGPSPATPPAFAWSIITWRLSMLATEAENLREHQTPGSTSGPLSAPSALERAIEGLTKVDDELFDKKMPYQDIGETCTAYGVLEIVTQLLNLGMRSYGTTIDQVSRDRFRFLLLHLLRAGLSSRVVDYAPDVIICAHAIMTGDRTFRTWMEDDAPRHIDPITAFFLKDDEVLRPLLIDEARLRYPYELTPLLKFSSALTRGEKPSDDRLPATASMLTAMETFMQNFPVGPPVYSSIREEENANCVSLDHELPQFSSTIRGAKLLREKAHAGGEDSMVIPAGTEGVIVDDKSPPFVAMWRWPHSAMEYLVQLLSTFVVGSCKVEYTSQQPISLENATEIIGFFSDLLHSSLREDDGVASAELLNALNIGQDRSADTVAVVLAVFDDGLLLQSREPGNPDLLELLVNCIRFLQALALVAPNRVWPWLTRSRFLETQGNGGSLASVLIGTEMVVGRYDFLIGCIQLFHSLVEDAVGKSVARKATSKAVTRFNTATTSDSGISDKVMSNILLSFGRTIASIYEGAMNWRYIRLEDQLEINICICTAFDAVMRYAYGVDDSNVPRKKVTGVIAPIAEYLTQLYLPASANDLPTIPILTSLLSGASTDNSSFLTTSAGLWRQQTLKALVFSNTLVRIATLLKRPWTHLEQQLFKATPLLTRLYATSDLYTSPVVVLLESLVRGAVRAPDVDGSRCLNGSQMANDVEPPSLLGHLGPKTAKNFLSVLAQLGEPLSIVDIQTQVWNLLSAVVSCKQQWFSLYLLTGSTPREAVKKKNDSSSGPLRDKALLKRALDTLANMYVGNEPQDWKLYSSMLEFVCEAQNHWAWAMGPLRDHKDFIKKLLAFLRWIPPTKNIGEALAADLNKFAALTCDVLAMYIHNSRQTNDITALKEVVPCLTYLSENALKCSAYNPSLHSRLRKNFEAHFDGLDLDSFKRVPLLSVSYGRNFFYDVELADKLLSYSSKWHGPKGKREGFMAEVERANVNLSLMESEIQLLQSWKLLALELSNLVEKDEGLARLLIKVVRDCMTSNSQSSLPEALFGQLTVVRTDLAFVLLQRLAQAKVNNAEARQLLAPIWNAVRAATPDFDTVFSSDSVELYRSLLRILYLGLQFHLTPDSANPEESSLRSSFRGALPASHNTIVEPISNHLLEILADTVAKGFRSLATQLHSNPDTVTPSDFALLTAILQTILAIPEMTTWHSQAALLFANSSTIRYATSLFSWSDRLVSQNKDPIYGELSILFLLSLSSLQPLAESMAVEGILATLNSANLLNYFRRRGGMSPFDAPPCVFLIWTKGILPLCLNLLRAVGPAIAAEISAFLNNFPEQLSRASNALNLRSANTRITLSIASEIHSLALIDNILDNVRANGARLGVSAQGIERLEWDKESVREDLEGWLGKVGRLRERIVVVDERDAGLVNRKAQGEWENELEGRVVGELRAAAGCLGVGKSG
ncbi:hypothetical protein M011DRAFT_425644 [Sporormia fimetaria CBS 119925]|uniref:Nucleoporin NUP188 n=1 Tax=Sporormia fimetaria CBS 119925 TaxID=1340428 RepID=A0A6A6V9V3_9PLEO|nr:hypothetical protein M011DRAFT_425644 [Sporormia fimetaria CBS 119925]